MEKTYPKMVEYLIPLYCAFNSKTIVFEAWLDSPLEAYGWVAFLIWIIPLVFYRFFISNKKVSTPLLITALVISSMGVGGSLNALKYMGFACSLAAFVPFSKTMLLWFLCWNSWTPTVGWFGMHFFPNYIFLIRIVIASIATYFLILKLNYQTASQKEGL